MKHAVLTNERGHILGVIAYKNKQELEKKTFSLIESSVEDEIKTHIGEIIVEKTFSVQFNHEPSEDFYLTETDIL